MSLHDPKAGETWRANLNLAVEVVAVWTKRIDVAVIVCGERTRPVSLPRATFEQLFHGPVSE